MMVKIVYRYSIWMLNDIFDMSFRDKSFPKFMIDLGKTKAILKKKHQKTKVIMS